MLDENTTEYIIPYGQTKIGNNDFSHCAALAHLYIPYYVEEIPDSNFFDRSKVFKRSLQAPGFTIHGEKGTVAEAYANKAGILFKESTMWVRENHLMAYFGKEGEVFIPSEIEKIRYRAFRYAPHVFFVDISNNITGIDSEAFANCAIKEIVIPKNVTRIGSRVFMNCKELVSATFENANTGLDNECFKGCHNDFVIKSHSGGTVEEYARKYNIKFEAI